MRFAVLLFLLSTPALAQKPPTIPPAYQMPYIYCTDTAEKTERGKRQMLCIEWWIYCPKGNPVVLPESKVVVCPKAF